MRAHDEHVDKFHSKVRTYFLGLLFEFLDGTFVDTTAFVDQMSSGSRFTRIDVADDDDVNMNLFFTHFQFFKLNITLNLENSRRKYE